MRPLHIGSYLFHYHQSCGTTFAARGLSRALARISGCRVTLYCCGPDNDRLRGEAREMPNRQLVRYDTSGNPNPFYVPRALLQRIVRNEDQVDLLLIHGNFNPKSVAVSRAVRRSKVPYVACPSGFYHPEVFRKNPIRKWAYSQLFEKPLLRSAGAVQVFSECQIQALRDYGVDTPSFVLPNGFDPAEVPTFEKRRTRSPAQATPPLVYLGRIDMYTKGLDLLIQALAAGLRSGRLPADLALHCTGPDWGDQSRLQEMANQLGIGGHVKFFGKVDDRARWEVIALAELMVLVSRHDSFPTTVIEGLAAAKPVLLSENTGISRLVQTSGSGFLVAPTVESIGNGLRAALDRREEWAEMGLRGQAAVYRELAWDRIAQRALPHYERIVREHSRRHERPMNQPTSRVQKRAV